MQEQKFTVTCPGTLFSGNSIWPTRARKKYVDVSRPRYNGMHYVTHIFDWREKHKFSITCPNTLFLETAQGPSEHEK
jgi:hypothetical protein